MTDTYVDYFLNTRSSVRAVECIEIIHTDFTTTYRCVRNVMSGVTVTHEDGEDYTYTYYPLRITAKGARDNLDASLEIYLGDLGEIIPTEMDAITEADGFGTKPTVKYRIYRSDDLTAPIYGPLILEIKDFSFTREGSKFEAKAPSLNINSTGELYDLDRFPMLRGFL